MNCVWKPGNPNWKVCLWESFFHRHGLKSSDTFQTEPGWSCHLATRRIVLLHHHCLTLTSQRYWPLAQPMLAKIEKTETNRDWDKPLITKWIICTSTFLQVWDRSMSRWRIFLTYYAPSWFLRPATLQLERHCYRKAPRSTPSQEVTSIEKKFKSESIVEKIWRSKVTGRSDSLLLGSLRQRFCYSKAWDVGPLWCVCTDGPSPSWLALSDSFVAHPALQPKWSSTNQILLSYKCIIIIIICRYGTQCVGF